MEKFLTLANGIKIPKIGLGTYKSLDDELINALDCAYKEGYRHLDCADYYHNQDVIGKWLKKSNIDRKEIFITSKIWSSDRGYENTLKAFDRILKDFQTDYLDLLLVHWPANELYSEDWENVNRDTWRAFEKLYKDGRVKSIGVSNFLICHLESLLTFRDLEVKPMVNQIELHPGHNQTDLVNYSKENNIVVECWAPLGRGKILNDPVIVDLARKNNKTPAQITLNYLLSKGLVILPKSINSNRIKENFNVNNFKLTDEDVKKIHNLEGKYGNCVNPNEVNY